MARSRLKDIVMDCARPSALAAFWATVLGPIKPAAGPNGTVLLAPEGNELCAFPGLP
jgi:hypothetical protein